uniref:Uncharacterized protein n=1 Tax=Prolemur simus TaxID=1328070 RepID=A0A8C9AMV7_PROSS
MAHAPARCPGARGSGDGEMDKPRKVALITGITGQVSAEALQQVGPHNSLSYQSFRFSGDDIIMPTYCHRENVMCMPLAVSW